MYEEIKDENTVNQDFMESCKKSLGYKNIPFLVSLFLDIYITVKVKQLGVIGFYAVDIIYVLLLFFKILENNCIKPDNLYYKSAKYYFDVAPLYIKLIITMQFPKYMVYQVILIMISCSIYLS